MIEAPAPLPGPGVGSGVGSGGGSGVGSGLPTFALAVVLVAGPVTAALVLLAAVPALLDVTPGAGSSAPTRRWVVLPIALVLA